MLSALNQRLLALAKAKVKPVTCANCGKRFAPFADREIVAWSDFAGTTPCPHCGHAYSLQSSEAEELAPSGPLLQPEGSRIEKKPVTDGQVLYYIPASGRGGGLLFFAVLWNGFIGVLLTVMIYAILFGRTKGNSSPETLFLFMIPFVAVGVGMAYAGLRAKYATHLLFLGPEFIRLQRQLFGRSKTYDLVTAEVDRAEQKEFYRQNYQPVYGIEVGAGKRRIRFGSALTNDEKRWLCAEIREFLRETGNPSFPAASPEPLVAETQAESIAEPELSSVPVAPPVKSGIVREAPSADEVLYHIPPSGRWGWLMPVAVIICVATGFGVVRQTRDMIRPLLASNEPLNFFNVFGAVSDSVGIVIVGGMFLIGSGVLYMSVRHRFLRHELVLNREEIRLVSILFGRNTRTLPFQQVKSVELFELFKTNGKPTHAIRVSGERQSFQFGFRLSEEEKRWLVTDMRQFLRAKGALSA